MVHQLKFYVALLISITICACSEAKPKTSCKLVSWFYFPTMFGTAFACITNFLAGVVFLGSQNCPSEPFCTLLQPYARLNNR